MENKIIEDEGVSNVIEEGSLNKKEKGNPDTDEVKLESY